MALNSEEQSIGRRFLRLIPGGRKDDVQHPETDEERKEREMKGSLRKVLEESPLIDGNGVPVRRVTSGKITADLYISPHSHYFGEDKDQETEGLLELNLTDDKGNEWRLRYNKDIFVTPGKTGEQRFVKEELTAYLHGKGVAGDGAYKQGDEVTTREAVSQWDSWIAPLTELANNSNKVRNAKPIDYKTGSL